MPSLFIRSFVLRLCLFGLACCVLSSCGGPTAPTSNPPAASSVASFYLPLSATYKYWYMHYDYKADGSILDSSIYVLTYAGNSAHLTPDGTILIHDFLTSDTNATKVDTLQAFVSDSIVVEYGSNDTSTDHRILRLADSLTVNKSWMAASSYRAPDGQAVAINATVIQQFSALAVTTKEPAYPNVYQVNYRIHAPTTERNGAYQDNAFHAIYYAQTYGKVLETCYDGSGTLLWEDRLMNITQRP